MAKVQKITGFRLSEINSMLGIYYRKQGLEHDNYMLQEHIKTKQGLG